MSLNHPKAGPNLVGAYQMSAIPFVTSSAAAEVQCVSSAAAEVRDPTVINFNYVTKYVTIRNTGVNGLRIGFTERGVFAPGERLPDIAGGQTGGAKGTNEPANYFLLPTGSGPGGLAESVQTFDVRCKKIVLLSNAAAVANPKNVLLSGSFCLIAGFTPILSTEFPTLTGSNGFTGIG